VPTVSTRPAQFPAERRKVYEDVSKGSSPLVKRVIPTSKNSPTKSTTTPQHLKSNESFVVLTQSQISSSPKSPTSQPPILNDSIEDPDLQKRKVSAKLFDVISERSDIDYPICTECADILLEIMSGKHVEVKKERDAYLECIKSIQSEGQITTEEKLAAERELEEVHSF
jgi:beclin